MKKPERLRITATQRLGKRLDKLEDRVTGQERQLEVLRLQFKDLRKEFAETMHSGNFEAMYRLEREENVRLRVNGHGSELEPLLVDWCDRLAGIVARLRPEPPVLTADEQRIVGKFRDELRKGTSRE